MVKVNQINQSSAAILSRKSKMLCKKSQNQMMALGVELLKYTNVPQSQWTEGFVESWDSSPLSVCARCTGVLSCMPSLGDNSACACAPRDWAILKSLYDLCRHSLYFQTIQWCAWVQWLLSSELKSSHNLAYSLSLGPSVIAFHLIQYAPNWVLVISNEFSLLINILYLLACSLFSVLCQ